MLGYRANHAARTLRTRRTMLVGLVMNNLVNASFHVVAEVLQRRLDERGYRLLLCITGADVKAEARYLRMLGEYHVDGAIVIGTGSNERELHALEQAGTPVVSLIRACEDPPGDVVLAADEDGAGQALRHLLSLGHQVIGCVAGPPESTSGRERLAGYRRALLEAGLPLREQLVVRGPYRPETGAAAVEKLMRLKRPPTALYIANHEASFGALPALADAGIDVPNQLSIICHEEAPWFRHWHPAITIVDNAANELAELATNRLLAQIDRSSSPASPQTFRVGARLIVRASTTAPPNPVPRRPPSVRGKGFDT